MIKYLGEEIAWIESYSVLPKLINKFKLKVGVEIGVAHGGHSVTILEKTSVNKLYSIDPFLHQDGYNDPMNVKQDIFDQIYSSTKKRLERFQDRSVLIKDFSSEGIKKIPGMIDFVYIDGDHSDIGVEKDLSCWYNKVREGGIISGHDYGHVNFPGVKKTVDKFFSRFGYQVHSGEGTVWWVIKKNQPISFIIPLFNAVDTIAETLGSIKNNISSDDEILIVDDGSTDNSLKVVKKFENKLPLQIIKHDFNKGGGATRNTAVYHSSNNLIFCLDADNILESNSIHKLKEDLFSSTSDMVVFSEWKFLKGKKITHTWKLEPDAGNASKYLSSHKVPGSSGNYLFTKQSWEKVGGYPEFAGHLDTWGFGFYQAINDFSTVVSKGSYFHRYGHDSYWISGTRNKNNSLLALQIISPYIDKISQSDRRYITNDKYLHNWFSNLEKRPLKLQKSKFSLLEFIKNTISKK